MSPYPYPDPVSHHHHHSNMYSKRPQQSRDQRADISRLLDPTYLSHSSSSAASSPDSVHAYVDTDGDLHDPDYRDFPLLAPAARRPAWEGRTPTHEDDDAVLLDRRPASPRERRRARYSAEYASYASYPSPVQEEHEQPTRRRKLRPRSPRPARPHSYDAEHEYDRPWAFDAQEEDSHVDELERSHSEEGEYIPSRRQAEWTPTCGEQFRRHWQALSLSLRFSLFRAQRRIRRRVGV